MITPYTNIYFLFENLKFLKMFVNFNRKFQKNLDNKLLKQTKELKKTLNYKKFFFFEIS